MMRISELLRLVWINLMENKFKMLLTSLGVVVGAATIVLVIAIGQGSQADVEEQFKNLNAGAIEVSVETRMPMAFPTGGNMPFPGGQSTNQRGASSGFSGGAPSGTGGPTGSSGGTRSAGSGSMGRSLMNAARMTTEDVSDIKTLISGLNEVTLLQSGETTILGGSLEEEKTVTVAGVWPDYQYVSNLSPLYGRFIDETDEDAYHAVIGFALAEELFEYAPYAYGDYLEIDGKTYEVTGVLESMGSVSSGISPDQAVYLPYAMAEKHIFGGASMPKLAAVAEDIDDVSRIMTDIETLLMENHPNASFNVNDAGSAKEVASNSANTLALLLFAVASIVFIVGGIGIMNVMFVSVKERTAEIGILKAVGCSKRSILLEFLLEASFISILGGVLGVGIGLALMPLLELFGIRAEKSMLGLLLALTFAVATGTIFGLYPAWKASKLVPIKALDLV